MSEMIERKWDKEFMRPTGYQVGAAGRINGMGEHDPAGSYVALFADGASLKISVGAAEVLGQELLGSIHPDFDALIDRVARAIYAVELARDANANSLMIRLRGVGKHDAEYRIEAYEENPEAWRDYAKAAINALFQKERST